MSARFEAFLAKIYVHAETRAEFLRDPRSCATDAGLSAEEIAEAEKIDITGLHMAANSLMRKREAKGAHRRVR